MRRRKTSAKTGNKEDKSLFEGNGERPRSRGTMSRSPDSESGAYGMPAFTGEKKEVEPPEVETREVEEKEKSKKKRARKGKRRGKHKDKQAYKSKQKRKGKHERKPKEEEKSEKDSLGLMSKKAARLPRKTRKYVADLLEKGQFENAIQYMTGFLCNNDPENFPKKLLGGPPKLSERKNSYMAPCKKVYLGTRMGTHERDSRYPAKKGRRGDLTDPETTKKGDIFISKEHCRNVHTLYSTLGHEFTHLRHYNRDPRAFHPVNSVDTNAILAPDKYIHHVEFKAYHWEVINRVNTGNASDLKFYREVFHNLNFHYQGLMKSSASEKTKKRCTNELTVTCRILLPAIVKAFVLKVKNLQNPGKEGPKADELEDFARKIADLLQQNIVFANIFLEMGNAFLPFNHALKVVVAHTKES